MVYPWAFRGDVQMPTISFDPARSKDFLLALLDHEITIRLTIDMGYTREL